jgi:membrane fusion protein (multidrug efflux system)
MNSEFRHNGVTELNRNTSEHNSPPLPTAAAGVAPDPETPVGSSSAVARGGLENDGESRPSRLVPLTKRLNVVIAVVMLSIVVIAAIVLGFLPRWRQRQTTVADMSQLLIQTVSVVSPAPQTSAPSLVLPAEIRPWREASIYARANGYLKDWVADIGAHVQAGQLLAEIETPDLDQQLEQAKAQYALAQANLHLAQTTDTRWQTLLKTSSVSEQAAAEKSAGREVAVAAVDSERANVRRLEELVAFQRVVAPFAGTVTRRQVDIGDLIVAGSGGQELFHIAQTGKLRVYAHVPEPYALDIAPGQTATLTTPENSGLVFDAKVITTSESIATASRTLVAEFEVDNSKGQILPYSYGEIRFQADDSKPPLTLPANALIFRAQGLQVGVVRPDDTVELRAVKVGRDFGQTIEILGGVTSKDRVIANPTDSLVTGAKVRVQADTNSITK